MDKQLDVDKKYHQEKKEICYFNLNLSMFLKLQNICIIYM